MWPHCGAQDGQPVFSLQEGISTLTAGADPPSTLLLEQIVAFKNLCICLKESFITPFFLLKKNQDEFKSETLDIKYTLFVEKFHTLLAIVFIPALCECEGDLITSPQMRKPLQSIQLVVHFLSSSQDVPGLELATLNI